MNDRPGEDRERAHGTVTRLGTVRALVLLAAVLSVGAAVLVCVAVLVFGPAVLDRPGGGALALAGVVFALVVSLFAVVAGVLAARARTVVTVVARGCGLLLVGTLVGLAALLLLISRTG